VSLARQYSEGLGPAVGIAGHEAVCDHRGALLLPGLSVLVVSDLHLEKGSSYARRGVFLPPYDTASTLARLEAVLADHPARTVISLGDSFHDGGGAGRLPDEYRSRLKAAMAGRDWFWVSGNHDPDPPQCLPGDCVEELAIGGLMFRHEPSAEIVEGEIAGHLHPGARIVRQGRSVRRACFANDGARIVMPAFGALTGSLNVLDRAFAGLFDWPRFRAHVLGAERVYALNASVLFPD